MYKLRGVPKEFETRDQVMAFLSNSPGYVSRQRKYLQRFWPGLMSELQPKKSGGLFGTGWDGKIISPVVRRASDAVQSVGNQIGSTVDQGVAGLGVVSSTGGDPRRIQELQRKTRTQTAGLNEKGVLKASKFAGKVAGNFASEGTQMMIGAPIFPLALAADPARVLGGMKDDYYERYKRLAQGDLSVLAERPAAFLFDAWAGGNMLAKGVTAATGRVPSRTATIKTDGGSVQRYTSPATLSRIIENAYNKLSENHPDAPVVGAKHRTTQRIVTLQEREMSHLRGEVARFSQLARKVKGVGKQMAFDRLLQYGWRTAEERAQALAFIDNELANLRTKKRGGGKAQARTVKALHLAREHITDPPPEVLSALEEGHRVMNLVEETVIALGRLTKEEAAARKNLPARLASGAEWRGHTLDQVLGEKPAAASVIGKIVSPLDRENIGKITAYDPETGRATVHFYNRQQTGLEADVDFSLSELRSTDKRHGEFIGAEDVTAGPSASYLPHTSQSPIRSLAQLPRSINKPKPHKRTQGILFTTGRARYGTKLVTESGLKSARTRVVLRSIEDIKKEWAEPWKPGDDVPDGWQIWNPDAVKYERKWKDSFDDPDMTPRELEKMLADDYGEMVDNMFPTKGYRGKTPMFIIPDHVATAFRSGQMRMPGYGASGLANAVMGVANLANNLFRIRIYLKPSYLTNFFANEATAVFKQGPWHAPNLKQAIGALSSLDRATRHRLDELMGTSASVALEGPAGGRGALGKWTSALGSAANRLTDLIPRRTAIIHELRKRGYKTDKQINDFLASTSKKDKQTLNVMIEEAQNSMGRFEGLGPIEREYLTTWIAVYPWLKAATRWTVRMPWDAPTRAAIVAHAGQEGYDWAKETLGNLPLWLQKYAPVPWLGDKAVTNPGAITPLSTGMDVGMATGNALLGNDVTGNITKLSQLLSPPAAAIGQAAFGVTPYGRESKAGLIETLIGQQDDGGLPRTVKDLISPPGETRYFEDMGRKGTLLSFGLGPLSVRNIKKQQANDAATEETLRKKPAEQRTYIRMLREEQSKASKLGIKVPRVVVEDLLRKAKLDTRLEREEQEARKLGKKMPYSRRLQILGEFLGIDGLSNVPETESEKLYDQYRDYAFPALRAWNEMLP